VKVKVNCTAPAGARCAGTVRLRTRAKKPKFLASKKMNVAAGKSTVTLKLSRKARRHLRKKSTKVSVGIDLGSAGKTSKNLTLKR